MELGIPELLIVLVIILMIFGVGRISKIGSELGQGINEFRRGLQGDEESSTPQPQTRPELPAEQTTAEESKAL